MHVRTANVVDIRGVMARAAFRTSISKAEKVVDEATAGGRLKGLRIRAALNQQELADIVGIGRTQIAKYEQGEHLPPDHVILRAAAHFDVTPGFIRYGSSESRTANVTGFVGAGAQIEAQEIHSDRMVEIPASWNDATAYEIVGLSCWPIYDEHDVIVVRGEQRLVEAEFLGRMCVVETADGIGLVKRVRRGNGPGVFTLESPNAPAIENVALSSARPVKMHLQR